MKVIGSTQAISPESKALDISAHIATALGARNGATLYALGFRRNVSKVLGAAGIEDRPGDLADVVAKWQRFLSRYPIVDPDGERRYAYQGPIHGIYDRKTCEATGLFQRHHDINVDGTVGRRTLRQAFRAGYRATGTAPIATIIASPFPTSSWGKLLRLSVIREPKPGGAHGLILALRKLGLACRFVEVIQPIALGEMELFSRHHLPRYLRPDRSREPSAIMTPIDLVIEIPEHRQNAEHALGDTFERVAENRELYWKMEALIARSADDPHSGPSWKLHEQVREMLDRGMEAITAGVTRVASLKPMHTLNALAQRYARDDQLKWAREKSRIGRRQKHSGRATLTFDTAPWDALLWRDADDLRAGRTHGDCLHDNRLLAISYADSEEKFVCWNFYDLRQRIIAEFDVHVPSSVADFIWREWVFEVIGECGGDVVASYTSPRLRDGGLMCSLVAVFPFVESAAENHEGDVARVLTCFDELLGSEGAGAKYRALRRRLPLTYRHAAEHAMGDKSGDLLEGTEYHANVTLGPVRMWSPLVSADERIDHPAGPRGRYRHRFKANPFFFTRPMTLADHDAVYQRNARGAGPEHEATDGQSTRLKIAEQIVQHLTRQQQNIAIVGAHRCGKSSLMNMVHTKLIDTLAAMTPDGDPRATLPNPASVQPVIPIRINAALTPIREFPQAILRALTELEQQAAGAGTGQLQDVIKSIKKAFNSVFESDVRLEIDAQLLKIRLEGKHGPVESASIPVDRYLELVEKQSPAYELRRGLAQLQRVLEQPDHVGWIFGGGQPVFAVMIDEVRDGLVWGEDHAATAAWRTIIEAFQFNRIRWLVASTRPIRQELSYSPVSNVFREKNLECLSIDEAHRLLDAFGVREPGKLSPVLTPSARQALLAWTGRLPFLMQVACSYVFERATGPDVPVITLELCRRTMRETVAMEMSDYFAEQWNELGTGGAQQEIMAAVQGRYASAADALTLERGPRFEGLSPTTRRALSRSGLEGAGGVAPLAAYWLLSTIPGRT